MKKIVLLSLTVAMLSSCATVFRKNGFIEDVTFAPNEPKEAYLYVDGEYKGVTPVTLKLDSRKTYDVKYTKRNYLPNHFELNGKVKPKYIVGNLAMGAVVLGWIPMLVDHSTGKWKGFDQMDVDHKSSLVYWNKITDEKDLDKYKGELFEIENLFFEIGKSDIKAESYSKLDEVVGFMKKFQSVKFEVRGHTDNTGGAELNQKLSESRAKAVADYLKGKGIDGSRLTSEGFGPNKPIDTNDTEAGRSRNRRVEFKLM